MGRAIWLEAYTRGAAGLRFLWQPHGSHLIFFPRLFFLADVWLFHGTGHLLVAANLLIQGSTCALLVREASRAGRPARRQAGDKWGRR